MSENSDFIRFCGKLIFGDGISAWEELSPEQQKSFCETAWENGWDLHFVRILQNRLPEPFYGQFRAHYQKESLKRMLESRDLASFYQFLESKKIPFVPIKGADWAFRIYPDQTLRPHGDWDILFRKEDCPKALQVIQEYGWKTFSGNAPKESKHNHHYERMHNERYCFEAHYILPHFGTASSEEIWSETEGINEYHRVLTPEMNLLLLTTHTSGNWYAHLPEWKILQDAGMLLKHVTIDWKKVHALADRWGILRPDILFHVWNDFFPEGMIPPEEPSNKQQQLIREIFASRRSIARYSAFEKRLATTEPHDIHWLKKRLKGCNAESICLRYHISTHQKGKVILYSFLDFFKKSIFFLTHTGNENPELKAFCQKVEKLEGSVKHGQK